MSEDQRDWLRSNVNISSLITIAVLVGGWVVFFATQRAQIADHDRRILVLEAEIVPRSEHNAAQRIESEKEKLLDERLTNIERMLGQMLQRRSSRDE
jgi:hypothetical protein